MATVGRDIKSLELSDRELWLDGPPHEAFKEMRGKCPVHWTDSWEEFPEEAGFWSVTTAEDIHTVSRDWQTYSSRTRRRDRRGGRLSAGARAGDVHRHGPAQARPPEGALPAGLHAQADRRPRGRDPGDRGARPGPARGAGDVRPGQRRRPAGRRAGDRQLHGHLRGGRPDLGETHELDARRGRPRSEPRRLRGRRGERHPGDLRALPEADRRAPGEPHRRPDERARARRGRRREARGARDRDGLLPADGRRQRQHQGDLLQRHAR